MAIAVLSAGAVAIMAMLQAATRGNLEAREMTTANQIAQRWVERLRRDALLWTQASNVADPGLLTNTRYLQAVPAPSSPAEWFSPPAVGQESPNFDFYGRDVLPGSPDAYYCTNVRLEWLFPGQAMRADVRVWWLRRSGGSASLPAGTGSLGACAPGVDPGALTGDRRVRMVYTSTVLRYTPRAGS